MHWAIAFIFSLLSLIIGLFIGWYFKKNIHKKQIDFLCKEFEKADREKIKEIFRLTGKKISEEQMNRIFAHVSKSNKNKDGVDLSSRRKKK